MNATSRLLVLLTVTVGLLTLPALSANATPGKPGVGKAMNPSGPCVFGGPGGPGGPGMGMLLAEADLTDAQLEKMLDLNKDMELAELKRDRERADLFEEMGTLAEDPTANSNRMGVIHKRLDELHLASQSARVQQHEKMMKLLTNDQWEAIAVAKAERRNAAKERWEDRPGGGRGQGMGPNLNGPGMGFGRGAGCGNCPNQPFGVGGPGQGGRGPGHGMGWWR